MEDRTSRPHSLRSVRQPRRGRLCAERAFEEIMQNDVVDMFHLLGRKKPEEVPYYLAWCDVAFISFADNPLFEMTIPAKLQSYMACGMPILAVAGGETKRIVEEAECGICCELGNSHELVRLLDKCAREENGVACNMSQAALYYFREHFEKDKLLDEIDRYVRSL